MRGLGTGPGVIRMTGCPCKLTLEIGIHCVLRFSSNEKLRDLGCHN